MPQGDGPGYEGAEWGAGGDYAAGRGRGPGECLRGYRGSEGGHEGSKEL